MLNESDSHNLGSRLSDHADREHQDKTAFNIERAEYNLFELLKPKFYMDGNKWCVLYGEDIQDGICGFGDSLYLAILDWNKNWNTPLREQEKRDGM